METTPPVLSEYDQQLLAKIKDLIAFTNADPNTFDADLISQVITTSLKMLNEGHDTGQLKLMTRAFKEMRYAYRIFNKYPNKRRISIFGSARTPETHPDYIAAKDFGARMAAASWVCITGAAEGIMRAGLEGAKKESSFGLSIRLPFETPTNSLMAGDPKLITFRYFFTRKLMFLSHSDAIAAFPGGVGTQDELFEVLTLMQTGKASILPVVLMEGPGGTYWKLWEDYIDKNLLALGWISEEDKNFYFIASNVDEGVDHVKQFYKRYQSSRYVGDILVIRMNSPLKQEQIDELNRHYGILFSNGNIYSTNSLSEETDHLDLPRIAFEHNHKHFGTLRKLLDHINSF
ncbi:MAG: LOG family protein [Parachlamydiaceae bacterium]|nr:LOG family protein [Parachlamydiaceae bacterium]